MEAVDAKDYTTEAPEMQEAIAKLEALVAQRRGVQASIRHERGRERVNWAALDAAIERLDDIENDIEATLRATWGMETSRVVDFLDAIDATFSIDRALDIATGETRTEARGRREYYAALAAGF